MDDINKFLKELKVATAIHENCDSPDGPLIISVTNYQQPFQMGNLKFIASVIVRYVKDESEEADTLYHTAFYQQTIGVQKANEAIELIMADPAKYKNH